MADQSNHDSTVEENAEKPVEDSFSEATDEGEERLHRSWPALLATGFLGGVEITIGVLAYLVTVQATGSDILGGSPSRWGSSRCSLPTPSCSPRVSTTRSWRCSTSVRPGRTCCACGASRW